MKRLYAYNPTNFILMMLLFFFGCLIPINARSADPCTTGLATPPFLSEGLDPNLLLIIDNSGSMLDLAYIDIDSESNCYNAATYEPNFQCHDDTYCTSDTYAGYFDPNIWYTYSGGAFSATSDPTQAAKDAATFKKSTDVLITGATNAEGELISVTEFIARGNFLNWAASSKLDIQKKILTGGKYDSATGKLIMESRGCGARRFSKKVEVSNSANVSGFYLTLGISPPPEWRSGHLYSAGDVVSDDGKHYITNTGGTSAGTGVSNDTGILDWTVYDISLTHIEIFKITTAANGVDYESCEEVMTELEDDNPNLGNIITETSDCLGFASNNTEEGYSNAALNHSLQNCWYISKHGEWQPGQGSVSSAMTICEKLYGKGPDPWEITENESGYVCYGVWDADADLREGFVGRCWNPGADAVKVCTHPNHVDDDNCPHHIWEWIGGDEPGWITDPDDPDAAYNCVDQALKDFCGFMEVPEVIDPSDLIGSTPEDSDTLWNIPAILIGAAVGTTLGEPIKVMKGLINATEPNGLVHDFAGSIRMGAMVFNARGSDSECADLGVFAEDGCDTDSDNLDGGKIISYIGQSPAHTSDLVTAINNIQATSWTPLAEAMYNAIGYYTQNTDLRLNEADFAIGDDNVGDDPEDDPVQAYCQHKHILIITEGASTADLNAEVKSFIGTVNQNDTDNNDNADCGDLAGSTYLDDLTYYAYETDSLFPAPPEGEEPRNIVTHIVVSGTLRDLGDTECSPDVLLANAATNGGTSLYTASNPEELEETLRDLLFALSTRASAGSAASVISSSRGGEGATYQAIFWPRVEFKEGNIQTDINWIGEVHSLLVDQKGKLYEDTNRDKALTRNVLGQVIEDKRVIFYFDEGEQKTRACYEELESDGTCKEGSSKSLKQVRYLWSAAEWLSDITPTELISGTNILSNRSPFISIDKKRYIFTWNDLNNNGIVNNNEVLDFVPTTDWGDALLSSANAAAVSRGQVPLDFNVGTSDEVNQIISWVRGKDQSGMRSRRMPYDTNYDGTDDTFVTWRLGDVIHSTPMSVSSPSEGFHLLYKDWSYATFVAKYKNRRHMIYFGGNDGMLHAVNGGFFDEHNLKFCRNNTCTDEDVIASSSPDLGAEMWAYVPYNLLPHLKCLTDPGYAHKYFVDQRARIFDVRIFDDDATHPGGWGTILVGAMGLGGATLPAESLPNAAADGINDNREFISAYFVLDITDPEEPPVLLGEMTQTTASGTDMAYTLAVPTIVTMKDGPDKSNTTWYLILGSGPTEVDGTSTQNGKLAVVPLNWLADKTAPFRIPDVEPSLASNQGGRYILDANSFVSGMITVDFELNNSYKSDAVYFGTTSGDWGAWEGKLYRLVTRKLNILTDDQEVTLPSQWGSLLNPLANPALLIDAQQPVTAAPSMGFDGKNYWVFFGTGRFYDINDKSDDTQQTYYGIKEPLSFTPDGVACNSTFTWQTVEKTASGIVPGSLGLTPVGDIRIQAKTAVLSGGTLKCADETTDCLPKDADEEPLSSFNALVDYIAGTGTGCGADDSMGTDGWYKDFSEDKERNLGQAALLGGLLSFTTYQPYSDICRAEGLSYLYGLYFKTGTAYYPDVFGLGADSKGNVVERIDLGPGQTQDVNLHVGENSGTKAFVQTSTGAIMEIEQPGTPDDPGTGLAGWSDEE